MPRDLVVDVPGYGVNKLNSAYLFGKYYQEPGGGKSLAVRTVSQFFNVPIDYYLTVNFDGFRKIIDAVGGVDIDVPYAIDDYNYPSDDEGDLFGTLHVHFDEGPQHMDGKSALRYARTRHADNDFMRNKRQLQVILAARKAALKVDILPKLPDLIDKVAGAIETNVTFREQMSLAQFMSGLTASDIVTSTLDRQMIVPTVLPDGSEGLNLDWEAAGPTLSEFFGDVFDEASAADRFEVALKETGGRSVGTRATATPVKAKKSDPKQNLKATPTRPRKVPTAVVTRVPTETPTVEIAVLPTETPGEQLENSGPEPQVDSTPTPVPQ
jgi:LCP family protein required for cell wall assembly